MMDDMIPTERCGIFTIEISLIEGEVLLSIEMHCRNAISKIGLMSIGLDVYIEY